MSWTIRGGLMFANAGMATVVPVGADENWPKVGSGVLLSP
jgi:hypothetical protein